MSNTGKTWAVIDLAHLEPLNVIAQPANRGTGNGILPSLVWILTQDPYAPVVFLPADHCFENEASVASAIEVAVQEVHAALTDPVLIRRCLPGATDRMLAEVVRARRMRSASVLAPFYETPLQCVLSTGLLMNCPIPLSRVARGAASALAMPTLATSRLSLATSLMNAER